MSIRDHARSPFQQRGAVLFISLIILVVMTLIGVTAMKTTTLDTKIAGNNKNYRISVEAAEAALTEGESRLAIPFDLNAEFPRPRKGTNSALNLKIWDMRSDNPTACNDAASQDPWWFQWNLTCWNNYAYSYSSVLYGMETTTSKPFYVIEYLGRFREPLNWQEVGGDLMIKDYYRITARGSTGQNSQSEVLLQSVFAWRYRDN